MRGHFVIRKHRLLAGVLLFSGSLAGFGLGQQIGHARHQQAAIHLAHQQAISVASAIGSQSVTRVVTTAPPVPAHHTSTGPAHRPAPPTPAKSPPVGHRRQPVHHKTMPPQPAAPVTLPVITVQVVGPVQISVTAQPTSPPAQPAGYEGSNGNGHGKDDGRPISTLPQG